MTLLLNLLNKNQNSIRSCAKYFFVIFFLCRLSYTSFSQDQHVIDSLKKILPSLTDDGVKIQTYNALAAEIVDINPSQSINYATEA